MRGHTSTGLSLALARTHSCSPAPHLHLRYCSPVGPRVSLCLMATPLRLEYPSLEHPSAARKGSSQLKLPKTIHSVFGARLMTHTASSHSRERILCR